MTSNSKIHLPPWNFTDSRIDNLCSKAWQRLPAEVQTSVAGYVLGVSDVQQWSSTEKQGLADQDIRRNPAEFSSGERHIRVCIEDCESASENAIVGAFVHEIAHAYQQRLTPDTRDADKCEEAGDLLPICWGFTAEIQELKEYRTKFC